MVAKLMVVSRELPELETVFLALPYLQQSPSINPNNHNSHKKYCGTCPEKPTFKRFSSLDVPVLVKWFLSNTVFVS